jgi:hypothetical protein
MYHALLMLVYDGNDDDGDCSEQSPNEETYLSPKSPSGFPSSVVSGCSFAGEEGIFFFNLSFRGVVGGGPAGE